MDPLDLEKAREQALKRIYRVILDEAYSWYVNDPDAYDLVITASCIAAGNLPKDHNELLVLLTLHRHALLHSTTKPPALTA